MAKENPSVKQLTDEELNAFLEELSLFDEKEEQVPSPAQDIKKRKNFSLWMILFLPIAFASGFFSGWQFKPHEKEPPILNEIYEELKLLREELKQQKESPINEDPLFQEIIEPFDPVEAPLA